MLFDWLVVGQVLAVNPAAAVRGPKYVVRTGKTPVLAATEARQLLDSIDTDDRRRPARPGADRPTGFYLRPHRRGARHDRGGRLLAAPPLWVRLHEKGGKEHAMPCHHNLETYLQDYIEAAGLAGDREGPLSARPSGAPAF